MNHIKPPAIQSLFRIVLMTFVFLVGIVFSTQAQSAYPSYIEAKKLYDDGHKEDAFATMNLAFDLMHNFSEDMSHEEAMNFFEFYANLSHEMNDYGKVDSVYWSGIKYGKTINSDSLSCNFILRRGNYWRILGKHSKAIDIFKTGLGLNCNANDYIHLRASIGREYIHVNFDSVPQYTLPFISLAEELKDTLNLMNLNNNMAGYYRLTNQKAKSFEYERNSLEYEQKYPVIYFESHLNVARILIELHHLSLAEEYVNAAELFIADRMEPKIQSQLNRVRAKLEFARKNYSKAMEYNQFCVDLARKKNFDYTLSSSLAAQAKYAKAANNHEVYEQCIEELEPLLKRTKSTTMQYNIISAVSKYYVNQQQTTKAKALMAKLDDGLEEIDWVGRIDYLQIMADIAQKERRFVESAELYREINVYRDSIERTNTVNQVILSEQEYDRNKKNEEISQLSLEANLAKANLKVSKIIIGVAALFLALLGFFLWYIATKNKKITRQKKQLDLALEDKNYLLREIHHRVKNNLQVISSLLNLQANYISDDLALEAITVSKNRVSSMALIHQNLYGEENMTSINSKEYFDELVENLFESYNIDDGKITMKKKIDSLEVDVDTMIPLGLIVNELISNALKHAFVEGEEGEILIQLMENEGALQLIIKDNGVGMSQDNFFNSKSFGNKMIQAFQQKLNAEIQINNESGTEIYITIKNYKLAA